VTDLRATPGALEGRILDLDREVQDLHLRLRAALDTFGVAAALLSGDGEVMLANDSFEDVGAGRVGSVPAAALHAMVANRVPPDPARSEVKELPSGQVVLEARSGPRTFVARLIELGDRDRTLLAILETPGWPAENVEPV